MSDLDDLALAARSRELPPGARGCANCLKVITSARDARQWNGYLVCVECFDRFSGSQHVVAGRVQVPAAAAVSPPVPTMPYPPAAPQPPVQVFITQTVHAPHPPVYLRPPPTGMSGLTIAGLVLTVCAVPMLCVFLPVGIVLLCIGVPLWIVGLASS